MTVIELPDDQAAALKAKAAAQGLTLEAWFKKLAEPKRRPAKPLQPFRIDPAMRRGGPAIR
jgi:hypothetical protein